MRGQRYQISLILLGVIATLMFGSFFYRELFPEYKEFQKNYIALEKFRSAYSGQPPVPFQVGVKQIVFERADKGPAKIDRCISCHVAMQIPQFSPTKLAHRDANGNAEQVPNEEYVWAKLDQEIAFLRNPTANAQLEQAGKGTEVQDRLAKAQSLESLKTVEIDGRRYDATKVLAMHPLIGKETRPFEFHPLEEYGCSSCHGGNGRALTVDKAHGPVFDGHYEEENTGPRPAFSELDAQNSPRFARMFNHKPGDALLFQTTPILPGALIQANCVQCHKPSARPEQGGETTDIDVLTENYQQGQQLYIAQACYACHRIAGFARGGVGPELTRSGFNYPWYLKQKVVWPQGDLRTSTMPNLGLDHMELENLMTFLLAQRGSSKLVGEVTYKVDLKAWEGGRKQPWEEPLPPSRMHDLRHSMTIFATEGCAACHRLKGFESNVGFQVEKNNAATFAQLYREREWFQSLFKEEMRGSELVAALEQHAAEIDGRIAPDVRRGALLEEIQQNYPEIIESMYANFRYAARAKNHFFTEKVNAATTPAAKRQAEQQLAEWQQRVQRVLMVYIQEYGFGHLVCPKLNWSGVYRTDEWLMEHFHNPSAHVPKSIMPVFAFDDSKFYALTYMLDALGRRNREQVQQIWELRGFDPAEAFQIHCVQCHGDHRQGNGPVSQWIYPIPKNLANPLFMLNLTRDNVIQSITHGVKGTPMAPWGEVRGEAPKKATPTHAVPVLSAQEIEQLADWLFAMIPGATKTPEAQVPKWRYAPVDVLKELRQEQGKLKAGDTSLRLDRELVAEATPQLAHAQPGRQQHDAVAELFEVLANPVSEGEKLVYYIKKKFYTQENIEAGEQFFQMNCAVCHGPEADGTGIRASVMEEAKPRMLTNLDWLNVRDDLRLLRSIKYGVAGTAMTPWGDQTSSLQRIQLAIYIRSLSEEKGAREKLAAATYRTFDQASFAVENVRIKEYGTLDQLKEQLRQNQLKLNSARRQAIDDSKQVDAAVKLYQEQINLDAQIKYAEQRDQKLQERKAQILKKRDVYQTVGNALIAAGLDTELLPLFLQLIVSNEFDRETLSFTKTKDTEAKKQKQVKQIVQALEAKLAALHDEKVAVEGRIVSPDREAALHEIKAKTTTYTKIKYDLRGFAP